MSGSERDDRLKWTKKAELRLREELRYIALKKCDPVVAEFARCAEDAGLSVIFKCKAQSQKMNDCIISYTNAESFADYKDARERELLGKSLDDAEAAVS